MNPRFHGAWLLQSYELTDASGATTLPLGERPVGLFTFDASGYFSVQLGPRNDDGARYASFYGTWSAPDGESGLAVLTVAAGSAPARINGDLHRNFLFLKRDLLRMRPPAGADGSQATILWRRAGAG